MTAVGSVSPAAETKNLGLCLGKQLGEKEHKEITDIAGNGTGRLSLCHFYKTEQKLHAY